MFLESIGAGEEIACTFESFAARGLILARVAAAARDEYRLYAEEGELAAEPSGALWFRSAGPAAMPVTGDWVAARIVAPGQAIVEAVLPRRTCFSRRAAGRREVEQPLAANIDLAFVVCGLDGDFNVRRIERYLALAVESGASAVIVLNKADVCDSVESRLRDARAVAGAAPVLIASALQGSLAELEPFLAPGRTVALLGSSGAGKSTILNRLLGAEHAATAPVREHDSRGRHTTTRRELTPLAGRGALIDTPGLRELQLWAGSESVEQAFEDLAGLAAGCRYRDCSHTSENGCAVRAALTAGTIDSGRVENYRKLLAEARRHESATAADVALERKRRQKRISKLVKQYYKHQR